MLNVRFAYIPIQENSAVLTIMLQIYILQIESHK